MLIAHSNMLSYTFFTSIDTLYIQSSIASFASHWSEQLDILLIFYNLQIESMVCPVFLSCVVLTVSEDKFGY